MTGIVKTDQLQGAQGTTVTVPTGNTLAVTSNATVGGTLGVTGNTTLSGNLSLADNNKIYLGTGNDLEIYHNGSESYIADVGTGGVKFRASTIRWEKNDGSETLGGVDADGGWFFKANNTNALVIDTGGSVTKPLTPFVRLQLTSHVSANSSVSAPGNQITGFTVRENVGSYWNSSNNNFTCPVAGVYQVSVFYIKYPVGGHCHVDLHKNGSIVNAIRWRAPEAGSSYYQAGGTASVTCAANDVLDWHYFGDAGIHNGNGSWEIMLSH